MGERARRTGGKGEPNIRPLPHPVEQSGLAEQAEVPRQPWLRLAQDLREIHHAERAAPREGEQPQAGRLGGGAQAGKEGFHVLRVT